MTAIYKLMPLIRNIIKMALDTVLPHRCPVSGEIVADAGALSAHVWESMTFIANPFCVHCGYPMEFSEADPECDNLCDECDEILPVFASARSALIYDEGARKLILGFKHADKLHMGPALTRMMINAGSYIWPKTDILIPVPLHYWRLVKRRYNQAAILSDGIAKKLDITCYKNLLMRQKNTSSQGFMGPQDRMDNVKDAFHIPEDKCHLIDGKTITLIDDVYTTGATVKECCKILLENGAQAIHIVTVARAPMRK